MPVLQHSGQPNQGDKGITLRFSRSSQCHDMDNNFYTVFPGDVLTVPTKEARLFLGYGWAEEVTPEPKGATRGR